MEEKFIKVSEKEMGLILQVLPSFENVRKFMEDDELDGNAKIAMIALAALRNNLEKRMKEEEEK